jgi:hypothetical protein
VVLLDDPEASMGAAGPAAGGTRLPLFTSLARTHDMTDFAKASVTGRAESAMGMKVVRSGVNCQLLKVYIPLLDASNCDHIRW